MTVDVGRIAEAVDAGVTQPIKSEALDKIVAERAWSSHLAVDRGIRSKTSVCLSVEGADADFIKKFAGSLEKEGAAYDIAGYRDAPPGLRIWCGATVDTADPPAIPAFAGMTPGARNMTKPKVLISDKMDPNAAAIFRERGCEVDEITGSKPEESIAIIGQYDGLAIRSSTKVTKEILNAATNSKVVGRAGIGVDNVDIPAASAKGVVVMNTPFGNSITTAEHAIASMFASARQSPEANAQTQAGSWPKNGFMGVEVTGKTSGSI
ncbi:hypothetical protein OY671_008190, partial [Metschnikowia pulcherrima]